MSSKYPTITRGTTPTITCTVIDAEGLAVNLTGYTCFFSIGKERNPVLTVSNDQISTNGNVASVTLTQAQTLALKKSETYMQLRAINNNTAIATGMQPLIIEDIIYNEAISDVTD